MLVSILQPHEQVCSQTTKYQVVQCVPSISISEQFVSKKVDNSPTDPIVFLFTLMIIHAWRCDYEKLLKLALLFPL